MFNMMERQESRRHTMLGRFDSNVSDNSDISDLSDFTRETSRRWSTLGLHISHNTPEFDNLVQAKLHEHCDIEYNPEECEITAQRLAAARKAVVYRRTSCALVEEEKSTLKKEQQCIKSLFQTGEYEGEDMDDVGSEGEEMNFGLDEIQEGEEEEEEEEESGDNGRARQEESECLVKCSPLPQAPEVHARNERSKSMMVKIGDLKAKLIKLKIRARQDKKDDGVLGVQEEKEEEEDNNDIATMPMGRALNRQRSSLLTTSSMSSSISSSVSSSVSSSNRRQLSRARSSLLLPQTYRRCSRKSVSLRGSVVDEDFVKYNMNMKMHQIVEEGEGEEEMDVEYVDYVRKPDLGKIIEQYDAMVNHPKYSLKQVIMSRRFFLYAHRFANAQFQKTLHFPSLPQPRELLEGFGGNGENMICGECTKVTEKTRTRPKGHRFIITADTQYGILMDGFAMNSPNWAQEIEISRKCVEQINAMEGEDRPLFVCVCGDLVDTESSFSGAIASWKKVMKGWERNLVFEQQVNDFKRVWSALHPDIALVCLCGNHDVGNRPTKASIEHWTSSFGDEYLSFWANGTFNLCLNNCLFSNPTGAPDLFDEQLRWMEEKLAYAQANDATHIFVYGHFPWFLKHEEEADDELTSHSWAPSGWGPPGTKFEDGYFTIPYQYRKIAMTMFKKYGVTACFSGHFHQNVTAQSSWGMPMIVTGPLSMNLHSSIAHELSNGEVNGIGMRIVDVGERGEFKHKWTLLDNEEEIFEHAIERCERHLDLEERIADALIE